MRIRYETAQKSSVENIHRKEFWYLQCMPFMNLYANGTVKYAVIIGRWSCRLQRVNEKLKLEESDHKDNQEINVRIIY